MPDNKWSFLTVVVVIVVLISGYGVSQVSWKAATTNQAIGCIAGIGVLLLGMTVALAFFGGVVGIQEIVRRRILRDDLVNDVKTLREGFRAKEAAGRAELVQARIARLPGPPGEELGAEVDIMEGAFDDLE